MKYSFLNWANSIDAILSNINCFALAFKHLSNVIRTNSKQENLELVNLIFSQVKLNNRIECDFFAFLVTVFFEKDATSFIGYSLNKHGVEVKIKTEKIFNDDIYINKGECQIKIKVKQEDFLLFYHLIAEVFDDTCELDPIIFQTGHETSYSYEENSQEEENEDDYNYEREIHNTYYYCAFEWKLNGVTFASSERRTDSWDSDYSDFPMVFLDFSKG